MVLFCDRNAIVNGQCCKNALRQLIVTYNVKKDNDEIWLYAGLSFVSLTKNLSKSPSKGKNTGNIQILCDLVMLNDNSSKKVLLQAEHTESYF